MSLLDQKNYRPWKIAPENFPKNEGPQEQIKFLLAFAILAPSGHNSQPWNFKLNSTVLSIFKNKERFLLGNDPQGRQSYISFGCMIENLIIASDYFGFDLNINYFPNPSSAELVASIEFSQSRNMESKIDHLINYITKRVSNRGKFTSLKLPQNCVDEVSKIAPSGFQISAFEGEVKNSLAHIMIAAQISVMDNPEFRDELSGYIKSNITKKEYGMPGFGLGMPLPVSLLASGLIKKFNMSKISKKQDTQLLIGHTPMILIISSKTDEKTDWISSGKILERLWLTLTKNKIYCSVLAAAVQLPPSREKIKNLLNTGYYPQAILRCGYSNIEPKHSPRFSLDQLVRK